ncbi:unnamed protein product, partial [Angiostrongylus costaricensis]|uniref:PNPLA domain-containing protein n=1 Tax=Angiostrongylus costaricensis TaxID=334426 RepID=A0A0R3PFQ8_ANGCS
EYAPFLIRNKISGASAGAIVATCLVTNVCLSQATTTILKIVTQARSRSFGPLHPDFNLLELVRYEMSYKLPADAYKECSGRLQISLTRWSDNKNVLVNEFTSNDDLIDAIICSCFIPVYCGNTPPTFRGIAYVDGGFSDNQPSYDDYTVTISPFSGESDICPLDSDTAGLFGMTFSGTSIRFTTGNLFRLTACLMPPSGENCSRICQQGFDDALRFISRTIAPCIRCLSIHTKNYNKLQEFTCVKTGFSQLTKTAILRYVRLFWKTLIFRKKLLSECDFCGDSENIQSASPSDLFPVFLKKAFEEAYATEDSIFNYFLSFRLFRYTLHSTVFMFGQLVQMIRISWYWFTLNVIEPFQIKGITVVEEPIEWTSLDDTVNDDSLEHVIEYTKSHDTMYEFHYLDENNQVRASIVNTKIAILSGVLNMSPFQHEGELRDSDLLGVGSQTKTT